MRPRRQDFYGELDELELGTRVSDALFDEMWGSVYTELRDRAWEIVLCCYRRCLVVAGTGNVPAKWTPVFGENGRWEMPDLP